MTEYQVIWRDQGDDYMITQVSLDTEDTDPTDLSTFDWVMMAASVEYAEFDEESFVTAMSELHSAGYDFIGVLPGDVEWIA